MRIVITDEVSAWERKLEENEVMYVVGITSIRKLHTLGIENLKEIVFEGSADFSLLNTEEQKLIRAIQLINEE